MLMWADCAADRDAPAVMSTCWSGTASWGKGEGAEGGLSDTFPEHPLNDGIIWGGRRLNDSIMSYDRMEMTPG